MIRRYEALVSCHDCGHTFSKPDLLPGMQMECTHCAKVMHSVHHDWLLKTLAFTSAGIVLFILANTFPFLALDSAGAVQETDLLSGVQALIERDNFTLAALVFVTIFLFPLLELIGLSYVLFMRLTNKRAENLGQVMHLLHLSQPWSMLEIFLIGVLVSTIKLGGIAELIIGPGLIAFTGLVVMLIAAHWHLSTEDVWEWLGEDNYFVNEEGERLASCHCCGAHVGITVLEEDNDCPRCDTTIYPRWPRSVQKTLALLLAAAAFYVPSNTLPMMTTTYLGESTADTIFSGVVHLAEGGDWPIALVIFVASIVVPISKLLVMGYLLWNVCIMHDGRPAQLARLFRITEFVGRWSMIDVFVVTILVAMVQFGLLANVEPGPAIVCFAAVVVLTMLAAETFDPRLIWDAYYESEHYNRPASGPQFDTTLRHE